MGRMVWYLVIEVRFESTLWTATGSRASFLCVNVLSSYQVVDVITEDNNNSNSNEEKRDSSSGRPRLMKPDHSCGWRL